MFQFRLEETIKMYERLGCALHNYSLALQKFDLDIPLDVPVRTKSFKAKLWLPWNDAPEELSDLD